MEKAIMARFFLIPALAAAAFGQVKFEDILKGPGDNWLTVAGDYQARRHSPLTQINTQNAGSLVPKWVYHVPKANGLKTTPIVYNGVHFEAGFRCDLLVEDKVIVEVKSIEALHPVHKKQVLTYLRFADRF